MLGARKHPCCATEEAVSGVKVLQGEHPSQLPNSGPLGRGSSEGLGGLHPQPAGHTQSHLDGDACADRGSVYLYILILPPQTPLTEN